MKLKIYIAGPMTGRPNYNRKAFNDMTNCLSQLGHSVLNPAALPVGLEESSYMDICLAMIRASTAMYMLDGWQDSQGAKTEYNYAIKLGLPITFENNEINEEVTH
ncbi:MAG: DUF4406 domain-containing protein [Oceanisphaera sp.]|uniref:DUF4406 domain-containing protein n=1 Tax=Oceanisphaera sp. TaxID=1929979 RepID=UPI003C75D7CE